MKLPKDAAQSAFQIGERKFALFASFAFVEVEEHDNQSGLLFRPAEVSCVTHTPDADSPFDLCTAHLQPVLMEADSVEDAALTLSKQILAVGDRIIESQQDKEHQHGECCGDADCSNAAEPAPTDEPS